MILTPNVVFASDPYPSGEPLSETQEILEGPFEGTTGATAETRPPPGITGDWGGARTWLSDRGVELSIDLTQGVQGVMNGGFEEEAEYLGSSELLLDLDSEKLGLWPGAFFRVSAEGRFGSDVLAEAGTLSPVNNDALFPSDPDRVGKDFVALTEMTATQFLAPWIGFFGGHERLFTVHADFQILAHGLGYSLVHAQVRRPATSIGYFINATPIDGERWPGTGSIGQVRGDLARLEELGAEHVTLDWYTGDLEKTTDHERGLGMLHTVADSILDLQGQTVR